MSLTCVGCGDPIDPRRNHVDGPQPRHVHCMEAPRPAGDAESELDRHVGSWTNGLASSLGAVTGGYRDTTAMLAEHPDQSAWWDYQDLNGVLRMTYVEIWARGCPGEPGPPARFEDRLPCRYGHLHRPDELLARAAA